MEALELSLVVVIVLGLALGLVAALFFSRTLKTTSWAMQSMTIIMLIATVLVALFSFITWFLKR